MMRKAFSFVAASALLALALGGVSFGSAKGGAQQIDLIAVHCGGAHTQCTFHDTGDPHGDAADVWVFKVPLKDTSGSVVGTHEASCTPVSNVRAVCTVVETLGDGTITEQGIFRPGSSGLLGRFAITGGTGTYEGAGGYAEFSYDGHDYPDVLHLS